MLAVMTARVWKAYIEKKSLETIPMVTNGVPSLSLL